MKKLKFLPGALIAVILDVVLNKIFMATGTALTAGKEHLVSLPVPLSFEKFKAISITPNFSGLMNLKVWIIAFTIAIVASIETFLSREAADKLDFHKRYTDTNVELKAQGIGNMVSSLLGGLPLTSVIVHSSANSNVAARSKMSIIITGELTSYSNDFK